MAFGVAKVTGDGVSDGVAGTSVGVADGPGSEAFSTPGEGLVGTEIAVAVLVELR